MKQTRHMSMNKALKLSFGALANRLEDQLIKQGFDFNQEEVEQFQQDIDAVIRLRIRGYIPDSQIDKMNKRLLKEIAASITQKENNEP